MNAIPEMKETCCVADQACLASAGLEPSIFPRSRCFACGQAVCVNCSSLRVYPLAEQLYHLKGKRVRLCNDCQIMELDGDNDKVVMRRLTKLVNGK
jgi:hypothetical protein